MSLPTADAKTKRNINAIHQAFNQCAEDISQIIGGKVIISWIRKPAEKNVDELREIICSVFEMPWHKIESKYRYRELVSARHLFCWFMVNKIRSYTLVQIGELIGFRDHTSVIHSVRAADDFIATKDGQFYPYYQKVSKLFYEQSQNKTETEAPALATAGQ